MPSRAYWTELEIYACLAVSAFLLSRMLRIHIIQRGLAVTGVYLQVDIELSQRKSQSTSSTDLQYRR